MLLASRSISIFLASMALVSLHPCIACTLFLITCCPLSPSCIFFTPHPPIIVSGIWMFFGQTNIRRWGAVTCPLGEVWVWSSPPSNLFSSSSFSCTCLRLVLLVQSEHISLSLSLSLVEDHLDKVKTGAKTWPLWKLRGLRAGPVLTSCSSLCHHEITPSTPCISILCLLSSCKLLFPPVELRPLPPLKNLRLTLSNWLYGCEPRRFLSKETPFTAGWRKQLQNTCEATRLLQGSLPGERGWRWQVRQPRRHFERCFRRLL